MFIILTQVIKQIHTAVKLIEKATGDTKALVQKADGANDRRLQDVLQPL